MGRRIPAKRQAFAVEIAVSVEIPAKKQFFETCLAQTEEISSKCLLSRRYFLNLREFR